MKNNLKRNQEISKKADEVFATKSATIEKYQKLSFDVEKENSTKRRPRTWMFNVSYENYSRIELGFKKFMVVANKYDIREGDGFVMVKTGRNEVSEECKQVGIIKNVEVVLEMFDFAGVIVFNW